MSFLKTFIKKYIEFTVGTILGASVATVTSFFVFSVAMGDIDALKLLKIQNCLITRIEVVNE